ncbi:MAG TPA: DUF1905 domain-containing protein [Gemmatimonadota bacterium]|nr:DUF1905 domain-containing protein [Gemmatimonadota bacterium]
MRDAGKPRRFQAEIKPGRAGAAYVEVPFDVREAFGRPGPLPVRATLDGTAFLATLDPAGDERHVLDVRLEIREAIGKDVGDTVHVLLEPEVGAPGDAR